VVRRMGGRPGDPIGRRPAFYVGASIFVITSLACVFAVHTTRPRSSAHASCKVLGSR
jgi:MFS family permease